MRDLKISLLQADLVWEDAEANREKFSREIAKVDDDSDLIILPEMFSTGFSMNASQIAEPEDGPTVDWMRASARTRNAVIVGSLLIEDDGEYYNRLVWMKPDGEALHYDKRHLFSMAGEDQHFTAGDTRLIAELWGWKICPFICYDLRFPVWTRNVKCEFDVALFVANWPQKRVAHWRTLLKARAIENQCWAIGVNRVGRDGNGHLYSGNSAVIDPHGEVLFEKENEACIYTMILQAERVKKYRQAFPFWVDADQFELITRKSK